MKLKKYQAYLPEALSSLPFFDPIQATHLESLSNLYGHLSRLLGQDVHLLGVAHIVGHLGDRQKMPYPVVPQLKQDF